MSELEPNYENIIKQELQIADLKRAYHTLMGQAVWFAEYLSQELPGVYIYVHSGSCGPETACDNDCMNNAHIAQRNSMIRKAQKFLASPEVQSAADEEEQP